MCVSAGGIAAVNYGYGPTYCSVVWAIEVFFFLICHQAMIATRRGKEMRHCITKPGQYLSECVSRGMNR